MDAETNALCDQLVQGRITRRDFVLRGLVLGLSMTSIGGLLSACGSDSPGTAASPATSGSPAKGGELRIGVTVPSTALNSILMFSEGAYITMNQMCEYLCWADGDLNLEPRLAESWAPDGDDLATWIFKIRQGVKWTDGKTLTADDVAYTLNLITDSKSGSQAASFFAGVLSPGGAAATDANTVVVSLDRPVADFPYYVTQLMWNSAIMPDGYDPATWEKNPVGTGPFILDQYVTQEYATFRRNPDYWQAGKPYLDGCRFQYYGELAPQVMAMQAGELDVVNEAPFMGAKPLYSDPNVVIKFAQTSALHNLHMKVTKEPWTDKRVRQALALCIDRNAINEALFGGNSELGNDNGFAPWWGFELIDQRSQDVQKAKQLMAEAGYERGFEATLVSMNYMQFPQYLTMVKKYAAEIGIDIQLDLMTQAEYYGTVGNMPWIEVPFGCVNWASRGTPSQLLSIAFGKSDRNSSAWVNEEWVSLMYELDATPIQEAAQRTEIARKMQEIQTDETPSVVSYWIVQGRARAKNVQGIPVTGEACLNLRDAYLTA